MCVNAKQIFFDLTMGLRPEKLIVKWKYCESKMNLVVYTYPTQHHSLA